MEKIRTFTSSIQIHFHVKKHFAFFFIKRFPFKIGKNSWGNRWLIILFRCSKLTRHFKVLVKVIHTPIVTSPDSFYNFISFHTSEYLWWLLWDQIHYIVNAISFLAKCWSIFYLSWCSSHCFSAWWKSLHNLFALFVTLPSYLRLN